MKQFLLTALFLSFLCCATQAKEKIIKCPPFLAWSSTSIEVDKVVLSDTATVLHIKAFYRPKNWIKIDSQSFLRDNNGETYPLRTGIGITPDKEFWMPESGEAEFQLIFPPLPASVTSIDFSESDRTEGAYKIWGIQLKKQALPKLLFPPEAIVHKINMNETLPEPQFCYGEALIEGKILDYRPGIFKELTPILFDAAKGPYQGEKIRVNDDGTFITKEKVSGITPTSLYLFGKNIFFFAVPNQKSNLVINTRELCRQQSKLHKDDTPYGETVYYNGALASLAQELNQCKIQTDPIGNYDQLFTEISGMDAQAYQNFIFNRYNAILKDIEKASISRALKAILTNRTDIYATQAISMTIMMLKEAHVRTNKLNGEKAREYFKTAKIILPENYYAESFRKFKSLNTPIVMYNSNFAIAAPYYLSSHTQKLAEVWGTEKGIFFDLIKANRLYKSITDFTPLTAGQDSLLNSLPEAIRNKIEEENNELLKTIEANKKKSGFNVNELGQVSNEDLFASLISKFRGKVILVDVWATWCGPCRMANKAMIPLKEELKDKDLVYLYITGETSPRKTWENMIPDIHGEHFRITNEQWSYLMKTFKINGVPTYFLIDREGNIKYKETGFPGADKIKEEIMKLIE